MKIHGYFAAYGNEDSYGTVVDPGAFSDWIRSNPDAQLPVYWHHDHRAALFGDGRERRPVGVTTHIREDNSGAYFEAELADTAKGKEVAELIRIGAAKQASFAFRVVDKYQKDETWHYSSLIPSEVSVIAINAANPKAWVAPAPTKETEE
jgi:HK97 family phage prohead protease